MSNVSQLKLLNWAPTDSVQTHHHNVRKMHSNLLWFFILLPKKLQKVGL